MKCYNCNQVFDTLPSQCPNCQIKINKKDYECVSTKTILDKIQSINDFAHFIGLFYVKPVIFLVVSILSMIIAISGWALLNQRLLYIIFAFIAVIAFNFFNEMRKVSSYYQDYLQNENDYIICFPFTNEKRLFISDAMDFIPNDKIMKQRLNAYTKNKENTRLLKFKTYGMYHPYKPKLFMQKDKFFTKFFDSQAKHFIKTENYDDESFVGFDGTLHGFLETKNGIITIFNIPKITKEVIKDTNLIQD